MRNADDAKTLGNSWLTVGVGTLLGVKAFNDRDAAAILLTPELAKYDNCDVKLNPLMYDSGSIGTGSVLAYRQAMADATAGSYEIHGIVGPARSDAAKPMAILAGIDKVPSVSYWATSDQFDSLHSNFPYFARTIPADSAVAKAAAQLFVSFEHEVVGMAYLDDAYGEAYKSAFVGFAGEVGITVQAESFQYSDDDETLIKKAVDNLFKAGIRVGVVVLSDNEFKPFFRYAATKGMTGEGSLWILSESFQAPNARSLTNDELDSEGLPWGPMKDIVDGMGTLLSQGGVPGVNPKFDAWTTAWATLDETATSEYVFDNFVNFTVDGGYKPYDDTEGVQQDYSEGVLSTPFKVSKTWFADSAGSINDVATYAYDASITLGMAACEYLALNASNTLAGSGVAVYDELKKLNYNSVSGNVQFDDTGSRLAATGSYILWNHRSELADAAATSDIAGSWSDLEGWSWRTTTVGEEFRFSGGGWEPPADKVVPVEQPNHLDNSLIVTGNLLVFVSVGLAAVLAFLTFTKRENMVIRASQPMFLLMILVGCVLSSCTILAMGGTDNDGKGGLSDKLYVIPGQAEGLASPLRTHDQATATCMWVPALYSIGFVITFAALFAKVHRIDKIFNNKKLTKVTITAVDMIKPIILMLILDGAVLLLWSMDSEAKLIWIRTVTESDQYNQAEASVGMCSARDGSQAMIYVSIILVLHIITLIWGNILCYRARNVGTAFSESKYVFMAMVSNMQILVLGIPILVMVAENPVTNYFIRAGIIFLNDIGVMLLIFVPKFQLVFFGSAEANSQATSMKSTMVAPAGDNGSNSGRDSAGAIEALNAKLKALEEENKTLKEGSSAP